MSLSNICKRSKRDFVFVFIQQIVNLDVLRTLFDIAEKVMIERKGNTGNFQASV